jgi:glycerol-3-phosphate dehydrogenase
MKRNPEALASQAFDLAIIGGGIQGACTAREAALRGLKVALVEARDFASGTSSRSSKLIHGGLRYLAQRDFQLVREARRERRRLVALAPHLARPIPFLLPIYREDSYSPLKISLGLFIYDWMGNLGPGDRHRMLSRHQTLELIPALRRDGLRAGALYHDSTTDDARLTVENLVDAADHGAVVVNYAELRSFSQPRASAGPALSTGEVEDVLSGRRFELTARFWVNAAGPWVDQVRRLVPGYDGSRTVRLTKGTHLIVPPVTGRNALLAPIPGIDRVFLIVPFQGQALLGTTDTDFSGDPATVAPDESDTTYLLAAANRVLSRTLTGGDVMGAWAGLRALALEPHQAAAHPSANTREYRFHEDPWARNFISICGGKLTTSRALAEKLVSRVSARLGIGVGHKGSSRAVPLPGGHINDLERFVEAATQEAARSFDVPPAVAARIVGTYGSRWKDVLSRLERDRALAAPLPGSPPLLAAEVVYAIEEEMAVRAEDYLLRRSGLSWAACLLKEAEPAVERLIAERAPFAGSVRQPDDHPAD